MKIQIKTNGKLGEIIDTSKGIPQGDCLSPILFTLYLANAFKETDKDKLNNINFDHTYGKQNVNSEDLLPKQLCDHNYSTKIDNEIDIDQQFADDIGYLNNSETKVDRKVEEAINE